MQKQTEDLLTVEARLTELPAIDAAVRGYIQLLRFVVAPSHDRDAVIAQLRSFQQTYEKPLMNWRTKQLLFTQPNTPTEPERLISWQVTSFELLAFSTAVIGYLHMLEIAHVPAEVHNRMLIDLLTFEQRYMARYAKYTWDS
ncbi:MAG: hypothetical protein ACRDHZ_17165 [Ktedonobacteraceae bacterium]